MKQHKLANITLLVILFASTFVGVAQVIANNLDNEKYTVLEQYTPKLGTNDTRPTYIKFQNTTGIYETTNGKTIELESFVDSEWMQNYRDYLKRKKEHEEKEKQKESFKKSAELFFNILSAPFALLLSPFYAIQVPLTYQAINVIQDSTQMVQETVQDLSLLTEETFDKTIDDFRPDGGLGSDLPQIKYDIHGEDNGTHYFVSDPTTDNTTDGKWFPNTENYVEIARGDFGIHYYNKTEGTYTFIGYDTFYTDNQWFTEDEYPNRYILRLTNGTVYRRTTVDEISSLISQIDNSTIWGIGYETTQGIFAFYLNFQDTDWGHAQYLWYPRLQDGSLPSYDMPLYAMYPHLYAKIGSTWYDQIINDRSLYDATNNPRNHLHFYNTSDTFGLYFETFDVDILTSNWDLRHGFKFNTTEQKFHMINEFRCNTRGFDDIGWGYEITQSPTADGTEYEVDQIRISNATREITLNISEAIQAGTYLDNFYSSVDFISILDSQEYQDPVPAWNETKEFNNATGTYNFTIQHEYIEGFWLNDTAVYNFDFLDMELAGFTNKYLEVHDQQFPDGSNRYCLLAGMYGYGSYTQGDWILVDPTGTGDADDNEDLYRTTSLMGTTWFDSSTYLYSGTDGDTGSPEYFGINYEAFIAIDTGINVAIDYVTSNAFRIYYSADTMETGEGSRLHVYNIGGNGNSNTAKENSHSYSLGTSDNEIWYAENFGSSGYDTFSTSKMDNMLEAWANSRGTSEEWISIRFFNYGGDFSADDYFRFRDSSAGTSYDADISITYVELGNSNPNTPTYVSGMQNTYGDKTFTLVSDHTDPDGVGDLDYGRFAIGVSGGTYYSCTWNVDTNTLTEVSNPTMGTCASPVTETGITNGYRLTWTISLGYNFPFDDSDFDLYLQTNDDFGATANSGWMEQGTTTHETELIVYSTNFILEDDAYSEDGNTALGIGEWFRGGVGVKATGYVTYEGTSSVYPANTAVDVQLWVDNAASTLTDCGPTYDDETLATGYFDITTYFDTPSSAITDTNFQMDIVLEDFVSSASQGESDLAVHEVDRDNVAPSGGSWTTDHDSASTQGYVPYSGTSTTYEAFYGQASYTADASGWTDSGVGTIAEYKIKRNGGSYGTGQSSASNVPCTLTVNTLNDIYYTITDGVGNAVTDGDTAIDVLYDITDPSGFDIDLAGVLGYPTDYAWISDYTDITNGTLYLNTGETDTWSISMDNSGTWSTTTSHGQWKVYFEYGWGGGSTEEYFEHGGPNTHVFTSGNYATNTGSEPDIYVDIINTCGNYQRITITTTADSTDPVLTDAMSAYGEAGDVGDVYGITGTNTFWFSDSVPSSATVTLTATVTETGSGAIVDYGSFGGDNPSSDDSAPYQGVYTITTADSADTITVAIYDRVGNSGVSGSVTASEDDTPPSGFSFTLTADANSGSGYTPNTGYYDDDSVDVVAGTLTDTDSGLPTNPYGFKIDSDSWVWQATTGYQFTTVAEDSHTLYHRSTDNVGNEGDDNVAVFVDTSTPSGYTTTWGRHTGIDDGYHAWWTDQWLSKSRLYYNYYDDHSDYFTFTVNEDGSHGGSGLWKTVNDPNSLFTGVSEDTTSPFTTNEYYYGVSAVDNPSYVVRIVNNAGQYQEFYGASGSFYLYYGGSDSAPDSYDILLTADTDSGADGYDPQTGYYDDNSVEVTETGVTGYYPVDLTQSNYGWQIDSEGWVWTVADSYEFTSVSNGAHTLYLKIRNNVGGEGIVESIPVTVDTADPSGFTTTFNRLTGWADGYYAYGSGSEIDINSDENDYFQMRVNDVGTIGDSALWKVEWDINSVFETNYDNTQLDTYQSFYYQGDSAGTNFVNHIVNNAGGVQILTNTPTYDDTTDPDTAVAGLNDYSSEFIYYNPTVLYFSDLMGAIPEFFEIGIDGTDTGSSGPYRVHFGAYDSYGAEYRAPLFGNYYSRDYAVTSSSPAGSITITMYDNVGNYDPTPVVITMTNDVSAPTSSLDSVVETSPYLHWSDPTIYISDDMGEDTQYVTITITPNDGAGSGIYAVQFLDSAWGDNSPLNDTGSPYTRDFAVTLNEDDDTLYIKAMDNVGNWESTIIINIIDEGSGPNVGLGIGVDYINDTETNIYAPDNETLWYGAAMGVTLRGVNLSMIYSYNGSAGISHVNTSIVWFSDSPSDSSAPYQLDFDINGINSDTGTMTIVIWTNTGQSSTDTVTVGRDITAPELSLDTDYTNESSPYLYYDGHTYGVYSDLMGSIVPFLVGGTIDETDSGVKSISDNTDFGDNPSSIYNTAIWSFNYTIDATDSSFGSFTSTYSIVDNVDNYVSYFSRTWFTFIYDNKSAKMNFNVSEIVENSPYLYYDGSSYYGFYGNNMGASLSSFLINGTAIDTSNNTLINWNFETGDTTGWTFSGSSITSDEAWGTYGVSTYSGSKPYYDGYIEQEVFIPVDDILSFTFWNKDYSTSDHIVTIYYTDASSDQQTFSSSGTWELETYTNYDAGKIINKIRIESDRSGGSSAQISRIDEIMIILGSGSYTVEDDVSFGDNPSNTGNSTHWSFDYQIDSSDSGTTTVTFTATDYVGNTNTSQFIFYDDTTAPTGTYTIDDDPDAIDDLGTTSGYYNDTTIDHQITGVQDGSSPPASGINTTHTYSYRVDSGAWGDWNTTTSLTTTLTEGTHTISIAIRDLVNNTQIYTITAYVDLTKPVLDGLDWYDAQYSDNFYKNTFNTAHANLTWTELYLTHINMSSTLLGYLEEFGSPSGSFTIFSPTITGAISRYYNMTIELYDSAGNFNIYTTTLSDTLYIDDESPTGTFDRVEDAHAWVAGYTNDSTFWVGTGSYNDGFNGSGAPALPYEYNIDGAGWKSPTANTLEDWTALDGNHTLGIRLRDNLNNTQTYYTWYWVDTVYPVLGWLVLNETYAPNWYDQSVSSVAQASINFVELNPYHVNATCTLAHDDDLSEGTSPSLINFTITGEADGSYSISIIIYDKAGNTDNTLAGSEAPIQLRAGLSSTQVENWFYFYFFRSDAVGLTWSNYNVSYVLDEAYRNYTEQGIRGALFAQKYLNITSSIRFIVRGYFGDVITNQSYVLPSSFDLYITLPVFTLKVANLYDEVMNMTIERQDSTTIYTEQLMPYEIFAWNVFAATYNVTTYIHSSTTLALDEDGNELDDFQIDLSLSDYALFVDAPLRFTELSNFFSEIWQMNILTNKDHRETNVSINVYVNDSAQGTGDFTPGIIILSRPQAGVYNLTVHASWGNYVRLYYRQITIESNAEITTFVISGVQSGSDVVLVAWNTNKGTGVLYVKDNGTLIATDSTEGSYKWDKSETIGVHQITFHVVVETKNFTYYADYTVSEWSAITVVHLYDSATQYVAIDQYHTATITVTSSDDRNFNGHVFLNGTHKVVAIINGEGTFTVFSADVTRLFYNVTQVRYTDLTNRSYIANDLTVTFDELVGHIDVIDIVGNDVEFSVSFNNSYDDDFVNEYEYAVYLDNVDIGSRQTSSFTIENVPSGVHYVTLKRIRSIDQQYVDTGRCNEVSFEIPEDEFEVLLREQVGPNVPIIGLLIGALVIGLLFRRRDTNKRKSTNWLSTDQQIEKRFRQDK